MAVEHGTLAEVSPSPLYGVGNPYTAQIASTEDFIAGHIRIRPPVPSFGIAIEGAIEKAGYDENDVKVEHIVTTAEASLLQFSITHYQPDEIRFAKEGITVLVQNILDTLGAAADEQLFSQYEGIEIDHSEGSN